MVPKGGKKCVIDNGDNDFKDDNDLVWQKVGKKRVVDDGNDDQDIDDYVEGGSSSSSSDEVVM
jgi:hypothetical protein